MWFSIVTALAHPSITVRNNKHYSIGHDLMILIDVSGSMAALDFSSKNLLTRLDITKIHVSEFISKRQKDRMGIIVFGKFAYLESPLTNDIVSQHILRNTEIGIAGQATAIGDAIALATKKLYKKDQNSRAIILLTDGENTGEN